MSSAVGTVDDASYVMALPTTSVPVIGAKAIVKFKRKSLKAHEASDLREPWTIMAESSEEPSLRVMSMMAWSYSIE